MRERESHKERYRDRREIEFIGNVRATDPYTKERVGGRDRYFPVDSFIR